MRGVSLRRDVCARSGVIEVHDREVKKDKERAGDKSGNETDYKGK